MVSKSGISFSRGSFSGAMLVSGRVSPASNMPAFFGVSIRLTFRGRDLDAKLNMSMGPIGSMYGIFTYIYLKKSTIHGIGQYTIVPWFPWDMWFIIKFHRGESKYF